MPKSSMRTACRVALGTAVVAGAVMVASRIAARRPAVAAVPAELRNPVLYLRFELRSERQLNMGRRLLARGMPPVAGVELAEQTAPGLEGTSDVRIVTYEPAGREQPSGALLWIHGGGMVMGTTAQDDRFCSSLADELGILVASVDYRLAPENPYPAPLDDCMAALRWLHDSAGALGVDAQRIAVGGASAGGGLAAGLSLRARDEGGPPICFQLLNYPMLDDRTVLADDHEGRGEFIWTPGSNEFGWSAYMGGPPRPDDDRHHAAPGRADDLSGLPSAWIGVGELDLFQAEDVAYAARLVAAGVPCRLHEVEGMYHGADQAAAKAPSMQEYRESMLSALREAIC